MPCLEGGILPVVREAKKLFGAVFQ